MFKGYSYYSDAVTARVDFEKQTGIEIIVDSSPAARLVAFVMLVSKGRDLKLMSHHGNEE